MKYDFLYHNIKFLAIIKVIRFVAMDIPQNVVDKVFIYHRINDQTLHLCHKFEAIEILETLLFLKELFETFNREADRIHTLPLNGRAKTDVEFLQWLYANDYLIK